MTMKCRILNRLFSGGPVVSREEKEVRSQNKEEGMIERTPKESLLQVRKMARTIL